MRVLLIDCESTGLDPKNARVTELGAMLVDSKWQELAGMNELVWESGYPAITPEVTKVTGITQDMLSKDGVSFKEALTHLDQLADSVDYIVAFNAAYDEELLKAEIARHPEVQSMGIAKLLLSKPWLCAMSDLEKNYEFKSWRLMHVALEYGVTVNPKLLHRAIADVELMRQMLEASGYTIQQMNEFHVEPWIYVEADVKKPWLDGGESAALAKQLGYAWERARGDQSGRAFDKKWIKRIKTRNIEQELNQPIKVRRIT